MKNSVFKHLFLVGACLFLSCQNTPDASDFPEMDMGYEKPVVKPFRMPEPDTIKWEKVKLKPLPEKKFDWDKLPTKPFEIGEPEPIEGEIVSEPFFLDSLPSSPFSLDELPEKKIKVKVVELGDAEIRKAGALVKLPGTSRGVMGTNFNFGLTGNPTSLLKDREGMFWIGTTYGLARYDSDKIEMYGIDQGLNISEVTALMQDVQGRIWVASGGDGKLIVLDLKRKLMYELSNLYGTTQTFGLIEAKDHKIWAAKIGDGYNIIDFDEKSVRLLSKNDDMMPPFITPFQDNEGLIWLTSVKGVNIIDLENEKKFRLEGDYLEEPVFHLNQGPSKKIWITNGTSITGISKKKNEIIRMPSLKDTLMINDHVFEDSRQNIWVGVVKGFLNKYSPDLKQVEKIKLDQSGNFILPILEDDEGQIWTTVLNASGGLFKINISNGRPGNFTTGDGLGSNRVWATYQAKDSRIWIGTREGIDVYDPEQKNIKHIGLETGLKDLNQIRFTEDSEGRIWSSGNSQGITIIDPNNETIQFLGSAQGLITDSIRNIAKGPQGKIWLGGIKGEIIKVNFEESEIEYSLADKENVETNRFLDRDRNGNMWIGWREVGIQKINSKTNLSYLLTSDHGLPSNDNFSIDFDEDNNAWIGGEKGLYFLNTDLDSIYNFSTNQGLAANDVYEVKFHEGRTYVGSSKGINILNKKEKNGETYWDIKTLGVEQGLNYLDVAQGSMSFDNKNRLWAGIENQILTVIDEIKEDTLAAKTYITGINITDERKEFNTGSYLERQRQDFDTIYSSVGERFDQQNYINDTEVVQGDMEWQGVRGPYDLPDELTLSHNQNYLSFNYNSLSYSSPDEVNYRYFLEGIDKAWSPITKETTSENYRDLPPGDYTFMVRSKGYNNIWSEPAEFSFSIVPPWWKTWWAYLMYALLAILILYSIIQYRSQWLKKENRILEERVSERTVQLQKSIHDLENTQAQLIQSEKMASLGELTAGIAHEIQNPLNFVNNFSEVNSELIDELRQERLKDKQERDLELEDELLYDIAENEKKIRHHGQRADAIVKGMLQHSRNNSAEKELTDINKLADEYLRLSYHGLRAKDKTFNASMKTDFDESLPEIYVAPQDIGRVILNLINNAFYAVSEKKKMLPDGDYEPEVIVSTERAGKFININITDNGSGIPPEVQEKIFQPFFTTKPSGQGTGLGLSLSYDIIKTHGGILKLKTQHGVPVTTNGHGEENFEEGTTFTIQLPANLKKKN